MSIILFFLSFFFIFEMITRIKINPRGFTEKEINNIIKRILVKMDEEHPLVLKRQPK